MDGIYSTTVGFSPKFANLNRFNNITVCKSRSISLLAYTYTLFADSDDDNRIILTPTKGHPDCQGDFINASFIDVSSLYPVILYVGILTTLIF